MGVGNRNVAPPDDDGFGLFDAFGRQQQVVPPARFDTRLPGAVAERPFGGPRPVFGDEVFRHPLHETHVAAAAIEQEPLRPRFADRFGDGFERLLQAHLFAVDSGLFDAFGLFDMPIEVGAEGAPGEGVIGRAGHLVGVAVHHHRAGVVTVQRTCGQSHCSPSFTSILTSFEKSFPGWGTTISPR
jgi:hypothetical protein